jgi:hypothetical protein
LINPNWELEFHVHTDASQLTVRAIFAQNPTGKFDQLVTYASRLLNSIERNYITIEKEALLWFMPYTNVDIIYSVTINEFFYSHRG